MSLLLAYYGDDFTGSTDVMEALTLGGVPTVLFLAPPTKEQLEAFPAVKAVGIAGTSRAMTPEQMDAHLPEQFAALARLGAAFVHYKVCSTFDSSPSLGSIGRALELGLEAFPQPFVPLVVGAPALKRYVAFGNLFATVEEATYRLDRHPTMSKHPATPMLESDLRRHLAAQTRLSTDLVDVLALEGGEGFTRAQASQADILVLDTLTNAHLLAVGELLVRLKDRGVRFVAGSSGLEYALVAYWQQQSGLRSPTPIANAAPVDTLIVVSGSAAPTTALQIEEAGRHGFELIRIDAPALVTPETQEAESARLKRAACAALEKGGSVVLYTALGPDDPALGATRAAMTELGLPVSEAGRVLGMAQGRLLKALLADTGVRRACVAGGDTCGYVTQQLGLYALELLMPVAPGSPLCKAHADDPSLNGLELALKAGQVGQADYFLAVKNGG